MLFRLEHGSHFNVDNLANKYDLTILEPTHSFGKNLGLTNFTYVHYYGNQKVYVKVYNPKISLLRMENEIHAYKLFNSLGICAPKIIGVGQSIKGPFMMAEAISDRQFLNQSFFKVSELDDVFFEKFLPRVTDITSREYGPVIDNPIFTITPPSKYSDFLRSQCQYYFKKYRKSGLFDVHTVDKLARFENKLFSKLVEPRKFFLCHGDMSPKHMFQNQKNQGVGVIDLEMTKSADITVDASHWLIHTCLLRQANDIESFINKVKIKDNVIEPIFAYNIFREYLSYNYHATKRNDISLKFETIYNICRLVH